jgi:hypothetical protein
MRPNPAPNRSDIELSWVLLAVLRGPAVVPLDDPEALELVVVWDPEVPRVLCVAFAATSNLVVLAAALGARSEAVALPCGSKRHPSTSPL